MPGILIGAVLVTGFKLALALGALIFADRD
jgi:hypothetical protein